MPEMLAIAASISAALALDRPVAGVVTKSQVVAAGAGARAGARADASSHVLWQMTHTEDIWRR